MVLERPADKKSIPVDDARRLPEFFSKAPALSPFRVAIIDAADDLNVNAANAVLKTLEEPPPRGVMFLVGHAPGRLLPTIRSRCRRLAFAPWPVERLADYLAARTSLAEGDARRVAEMAKGAPGLALTLAAGDALAVDAQAGRLLASLPEADEAQLVAIADGFRGGEGMARFSLLFERLADRLHREATGQAGAAPPEALDAWAAAWDRVQALPAQVEALNLDRADAFWTALAELRRAARVRPFAS
jgi:DNA polymerase-3 subunit delta'